jgi:choline dehydrogenase
MTPRSSGTVRLVAADPEVPPRIDTRLLSTPSDLVALRRTAALACRLAHTPPLDRAVVRERWPGAQVDGAELDGVLLANAYSYHHPCGTCRMGPAESALAVVDQRGAVHGVPGLYVVDASIIPVIPRVPLNATVIAVAERIAAHLIASTRALA